MSRQIVVIEWLDSLAIRGEIGPNEIPRARILESVGWLIREDEQDVTIAQETSMHEETEELRFVMIIPKVAVKSIRYIKGGRKR